MKFSNLFLVLSLFTFLFAPNVYSADDLKDDRITQAIQVTTNPGEDFAPTISRDGKYLIYVSDKSGNLDLWLKFLGPGSHPPDRQLTFHSASDNSPEFSPDGSKVVFVSNRSDPRGDIYVLELGSFSLSTEEKSEEKTKGGLSFLGLSSLQSKDSEAQRASGLTRLSQAGPEDLDPTWDPSGQAVYYSSHKPGQAEKKIYRVALSGGSETQVTTQDGVSPAVSPDGRYLAFISKKEDASGNIWLKDLSSGQLTALHKGPEIELSPHWSEDGRYIYFTRYQDDTNFDQDLTIEDRPSIWKVGLNGSVPTKFLQLTDSSTYDLLPEIHGDNIYFTSHRRTGIDIFRLPKEGELPALTDYGQALQLASDLCPDEKASYTCVLIYKDILNEFKNEEDLARIRYKLSKTFFNLGNAFSAKFQYGRISKEHPDDPVYNGLAEIEILILEVEETRKEGITLYRKRVEQALSEIEAIAAKYRSQPRVLARAFLEKGNFNFELDRQDLALGFYKKVIQEYARQRETAAEAAFSRSKIYTTIGDTDKVVEAFVDVVRNYYDVKLWTAKAISEILALFEKEASVEKKVSNLQNLTREYKSLPILAAAVQNRIGQLYYEGGENLLAKEAYQKTISNFAQAPLEKFNALFALAQIYAEEEQFEKSLDLYQQVVQTPQGFDEKLRLATLGYIRKSLKKGKWEINVGEVKLAYKTFLKLIDFSPQNVEAHRGYVQSSAMLKKVDKAIDFYKSRLQQNPKSAVDHYSLGLAYTYLSPPGLDMAEKEINQALVVNSQETYYHQTLGWVFEQKERLHPGKEYLEKALQEYSTALALNDENISPENEADLFLNLGNGNHLLRNHLEARHYYQKRKKSKVEFVNADREIIYYQRFGESAFKAGYPDEAVEHFKEALALHNRKKEPDLKRIAEMNDRIALAYQDSNQYAKAVEYFSKTLELHRKTGNTESLSKALRNIANNLYSLNERRGRKDTQSLNMALSHYFQSIENLEKYGVVQQEVKKESNALVNINVETGLDENASQAARGFNKEGEEKLIFNYVGKIYGDFGEYDRAIDYFQKKLALVPDNLNPEKDIPVILEKAILLNQIGNFHFQGGEYDRSGEYFKESYALSKSINNRQGVAVNAANLGRLLLTKSEMIPREQFRSSIQDTLNFLEEALDIIVQAKNFASPEYAVYLNNYLGIFYHYMGVHFSDNGSGQSRGPTTGPTKEQFLAALGSLQQEFGYFQKSIAYFNSALELVHANIEGPLAKRLETALQQNLRLTHSKADLKNQKPKKFADTGGLNSKWQFKYLEFLEVPESSKLSVLKNAEAELSRLPYGLLPNTSTSRVMMEELYFSLAQQLFKEKKFSEAFYYSERGLQQILISYRQNMELKFKDEVRVGYYDEFMEYPAQIRDLSKQIAVGAGNFSNRSEIDGLLEEYQDLISVVKEEDPVFSQLFSPSIPELSQVRALLRPGEVIVKYQKVYDRILVWVVSRDRVFGGTILPDPQLFGLISRITHSDSVVQGQDIEALSNALITPLGGTLGQSTSVYLLANGGLEFLPWSALKLNGKALIDHYAITHVSSVAQFINSHRKKNLYNSRLLSVELSEADAKSISQPFASSINLSEDKSTQKEFMKSMGQYAVVHIESKAQLGRLGSGNSYINLTQARNRFERMTLEDLFENPVESHFIALNHVEYEKMPDLDVSPTAPMVHALDYMGYPGILMKFGPKNEATHQEFLKLFYQNFRKGNPTEALRIAQLALRQKNPGSYAWTRYRFFGFPGMNEQEKNIFAKTHFKENVKKGIKAFSKKKWNTAISYFEKALVLIDLMENQNQAPQLYKVLAQAAYNQEDYQKAIKYQKELVALADQKGDPEELAGTIYFLGILYSRAEEFPKAVEKLELALDIFQEYEILDKLAESYSVLGIVKENALDYDKALDAFNASLKINKEIGEDLNRGRELRRIGRIHYLRLNNYPKARDYFTQAYNLFKELDQVDQVVETLLELGLVAEKQSLFPEALKFYAEAQALAESSDFPASVSKALLYQANTYWFQGDYQNAFKRQTQSLNIAEELKDKRQQTFIYNTLGLIYWTLNDSVRALENLNRSLDLAREIRSPLDMASAYNNIGLVYRKDKDYPRSIEFFQKALDKDVELKSKWGQGYTHRNLGISYLRMKRLDQAQEHLNKAVAFSTEIGNQTNLVKAKLELGNLAMERGQWDSAIGVFQETQALATQYNIKEVIWRAHRGNGFCLRKLNRLSEAAQSYRTAVQVVDELRAAIKVEEFQNGFLTDKQDVYKELILLLLDQGKVEEAFNFAERAKSRSFIDLLGNQKISLKNDISQQLYDKLIGQKRRIRLAEVELAKAEGDENKKRLRTELISQRNGYRDLLIQAKAQSPQISSFVTVEAITLTELYKILENDVSLVEYLITDEELIGWVISQGRIQVVRTPVKEKDLIVLIEDYRKRIQQLAPVEDQSKKLYQLVIQPLERYFASTRVLGIIPHGHLHYVSFSSLRDQESYLVEKHPLFYSPSASVLQFTFNRKFEKKGKIKVLALGNPDLQDFNYDLPLAELEAKSIKWDFPEIDLFTRKEATESWLQENIGKYQIIHIASHGEFDPVNPLFSSLKLTADEFNDGSFEVNEVFSLDIKADLVTLSACQTGLGEISGGDELVGLNRAFIYAGTHALVSSLWRVSDISTAVLIKHFYRNYTSANKSESLRKAQLLVKRLYPHPSYWAGFNLTGDYR